MKPIAVVLLLGVWLASCAPDPDTVYSGVMRVERSDLEVRAQRFGFLFDADDSVDRNDSIHLGVSVDASRCRSGQEVTPEVVETFTDGTEVDIRIDREAEVGASDPLSYGASSAVFDC